LKNESHPEKSPFSLFAYLISDLLLQRAAIPNIGKLGYLVIDECLNSVRNLLGVKLKAKPLLIMKT
jgi:hypothetical protein